MATKHRQIKRPTRCYTGIDGHSFAWTGGLPGRWVLRKLPDGYLMVALHTEIGDTNLVPSDPWIRCDCGQFAWADLYALPEQADGA